MPEPIDLARHLNLPNKPNWTQPTIGDYTGEGTRLIGSIVYYVCDYCGFDSLPPETTVMDKDRDMFLCFDCNYYLNDPSAPQ